MLRYLDIFAGAGGLSEGFIRAGFEPVAHVEMDTAACYTLKTRSAYHYLKKTKRLQLYDDYLAGKLSRSEFYSCVPRHVLGSVIEAEISPSSLEDIFSRIDCLLGSDGKLDLIVGGPPCQAYSLVGRSRDLNRMQGDKRNYLYLMYAEFLKKYQPEYFVFENVVGLLSASDKSDNGELYLDKMRQCFRDCGYAIEYKLLNASDYGVLQNRRRIIIVGKKGAEEGGFYPDIKEVPRKGYTVKDLLSDLPPLHAGEGKVALTPVEPTSTGYLIESGIKSPDETAVTYHVARPHNERDLEIYRMAVEAWDKDKTRIRYNELPPRLQNHKKTDIFTDRFKVVAGDLPCSHTVVAHIGKDGHYFIHPDIEQNRSLTPREAARLQTFPDDYYFEAKTEKPALSIAFRQIGNAVPVVFAEHIAEAMITLFDKTKK